MNKTALITLLSLLISVNVFAGNNMPSTFTYQGRLMDSAGTAALAANLTLYIEVRSPSGNCLLYSEHQNVDTTTTAGLFSIQIGSGTRTVGVSGYSDDPNYEFEQIFTNKDSFAAAASCAGGYTPGATDARVLRIYVFDGVTTTTLADQTLSPVPQASVADTVQGVPLQGLTQNWTTLTRPLNPVANVTHGFNRTLTRFEVWNGTAWAPTTPKFSTDAIDDSATDKYVMKWNATSKYWEPADVGNLLGNPGGDVSGTYSLMTVEAIQGQAVATTAPNSGEVLKWNGTEWEASADTSGLTIGTDTSQYLKWDGNSWEPAWVSALSASDGSPLAAVTVNADGKMAFPTGSAINEFSTDGTLSGDSDDAVPTEKAVKTYVDAATGALSPVSDGNATGDILRWNGTTSWEPVTMADGTMLMSNATGAVAVTMSQDVTLTNDGKATVKGLQTKALPTMNADGQFFFWDQTNGVWKNIDLTGLADGDVVKWDDAAKSWKVGADAGASGTTVTSIEGAIGVVDLKNGTTGTEPGWAQSGSDVTLNIPMASTASVTAGLISKTDYDSFSGKQAALTVGTDTSQYLKWDGDSWEPAYVSSLVASDGSPNPALSVDADGVVSVTSSHTVTNGNDVVDKDYLDTRIGVLSPVSDGNATGDILRWNGTTSWEPVTMADGTMLMSNATGAVAVTMSQDVTLENDGKATVAGLQTKALPTMSADGQIFFWDQTNGAWKATDMTGLSDGYIMKWDDSAKSWKVAADAGGLTDVTGSALEDGKVWIGDGSDLAQEVALSQDATVTNAGAVTVSGLQTKALPTMNADGQFFFWDQTNGAWKNIDLTGLADGDVVKWDDAAKSWKVGADAGASGTVASIEGATGVVDLKNGTTGTEPGWAQSGTDVTLNIPMASTASVTAGLLSKTDYDRIPAVGTGTNNTLRWDGSAWVETDGATITSAGDVVLKNAPTQDEHAATKLYVDTKVGALSPVSDGSATGDILRWDGDSWEPVTMADGTMLMSNATGAVAVTMSQDVTLENDGKATVAGLQTKALPTMSADGQIFFWDQTNGAWKATDMTGLSDGYIMKWDNSAKSWKVAADAGGTTISGGTTKVLPMFNATGTNIINSSVTDNGTTGVNFANSKIQFGGNLFAHATGGTSNIFLGFSAGNTTQTGTGNSAVGSGALQNNINGFWNTAIGSGALQQNTTGIQNVAVGYQALQTATASGNSAVGVLALFSTTTGIANSAMGGNALTSNTTGGYNTALGAGALGGSETGSSNSAVGYNAGSKAYGASSGNVFLGYRAGPTTTGAISDKLYINNSESDTPLIYGDFSTGQLTINGDLIVNSTGKYLNYKPNATECSDTEVLKWDATNDRWICGTDAGASGTIVTSIESATGAIDLKNGATGTEPAWAQSGTDVTLNIPMASGASVTAGLLSKTDYDRIPAVGTGTNNTLRWDGSAWVETADLLITSGGVVSVSDNHSVSAGNDVADKDYVDSVTAGAVSDVTGGDAITATETSGTIDIDLNVDGSTLEIDSDAVRVKDGGITTAKILDGTLLFADFADNGCAADQVLKRDAGNTAWVCETMSSITGTGTQNKLPLWNNAGGTTLGDSLLAQDATNVELSFNGTRFASTKGTNNLFLGNAGKTTITGSKNIGIGNTAMDAITSGTNNVAMGFNAAGKITSSSSNTAIGSDALSSFTSGGGDIVAVGNNALKSLDATNNDSRFNTAVGSEAASGLTVGNENTFVGYSTGGAYMGLSQMQGSTAVGAYALSSSSPGQYAGFNTAIGSNALWGATSASQNTAVGYSALYSMTTDGSNTALGWEAGAELTLGENNVFIGHAAGVYIGDPGDYSDDSGIKKGTGNVFIGEGAGQHVYHATTSSDNNVIIGLQAGPASDTPISNKLYIHNSSSDTPLIGGDFSAGTLRLEGRVGIKIAAHATYALDVNGDANIAAANVLRFGGTQVCASAGCTAVSDRRLKKDIQPLQNSLDNILKLQGVSYDWKDKEKYGKGQQIGLIAQDLEKVYPQAVVTDKSSGLKSVAYDHLVAPLIEAFKSLNMRLNDLYTSFTKVSAEQSREIASIKADNAAKAKEIIELKAKAKKAEQETAAIKARLEKIEKALNSK